MAREDLSPDSRHVSFWCFLTIGGHANTSAYEFQYRERKGGDSKSIYPPQDAGPPAFPVDSPHAWLRLKASSAATGKTGRSTVPTRSIYRRLYFWAWR